MVSGNQPRDVIQILSRITRPTDMTDAELLDRYFTRRCDAAYEALLHRHGPMVLGVCRRVLRNLHDAEDAFQATFLILALKGNSVRGSLGGWCHQVAYRTALNARLELAKRRRWEKVVATMPEPEVPA